MAIDGQRLIQVEAKYGEKYKVERRVTSRFYKGKNLYNTHQGCDRMSHHGYAEDYALALKRFGSSPPKRIVELGILKGTGLAMWSDLFPSAELYGLDIDLSHYSQNYFELKAKGAFPRVNPRVLVFDELSGDSWIELEVALGLASVDLWIDDAIHDTDVILATWKRARKFMSDRSVYVIEDNDEVGEIIKADSPHHVYTRGRFTAIEICQNK